MTLVSSVPAIVLLSCALVLAVGLACLGQLLVHRRFRRQSFIEHNEVGGVIFTVAGTLYAVVLGFLTVVARQQRIGVNRGGVAWFEWLVLSIGGACIVCFCWLFGLRNERIHLLMTSTVVTIMVCMMVLLFELQYPFRSDIGVSADAWRDA